MSATAIIAARSARVVQVVDARARTIGVRRPRPSERLHLVEVAEARGEPVEPLICAAAVVSVEEDGTCCTFSAEFRESVLWSIAAMLGGDGLAAVSYALWQHAGGVPTGDPFRLPALGPVRPDPLAHAAARLPPIPFSSRAFGPEAISPSFCKL